MIQTLTERVVRTPRHTTFHLDGGSADAPLLVFLHGWPELAISWRHQLRCFQDLGFRVVAPDMRGYGRSAQHAALADHAMQPIVEDMLELLDSLGRTSCIWIGHDWGSAVVWSLAQHHPERVDGVASLCVPYIPKGFAPANLIPLVDRDIYPVDVYPVGQWDYMRYYEEQFERARAVFEANPVNFVKAMFRKGQAKQVGLPARLASIRRDGGWFGGVAEPPDVPRDADLLTEDELQHYAQALASNGMFGPDAWYMNAQANVAYASTAPNGGHLAMPVLFLHAAWDTTCDTVGRDLAQPMREHCADLTELVLPTGHWMAQERPELVNAGLARWLALKFPERWPH
ncbi:MAG: alpha/beta hydrolase [Burkholderiaceae bacterium]